MKNFNPWICIHLFKGDCKYTLTKDCSRRSKFRVKIINHSHDADSGAPFTRSLVAKLHFEGYKIRVCTANFVCQAAGIEHPIKLCGNFLF